MPDPSKIHPILAERLRVHGMDVSKEIPIIVRGANESVGALPDINGLAKPNRIFRLISASSTLATPEAIERLAAEADVQMVWYDAPVHTMMDVSPSLIGVQAAWEQGLSGKGIKVGVVDSGIDPNHPDFAMRIAQAKDLTGEGPVDTNGHGTHVAGVIGGSGAASDGRYKGVAPECLLYVAKAVRSDGTGSTSDLMAGIEWAVQQGVQVLNLSPGCDTPSDGTDPLSVMCDAAVTKGIVVCVAAGNAGPAQGTLGCPGAANDVITVGATDKEDQMASFSSRGPTLDGRAKPDICMPGVNIVSCRAARTSAGTPIDDAYTRASGTSIAAAHAAGASALLLQACPGISPRQVKEALMLGAKNLDFDPTAQGRGVVDLFAALQCISIPKSEKPAPAPLPPGCLGTLRSILGGR